MTVTGSPQPDDINAQIQAIEQFEKSQMGGKSKLRQLFFRKLCEAEMTGKFEGRDDHTVGIEIYDDVRSALDRDKDYTAQAPDHLLESVIKMLAAYYSPNATARRAKAKEVRIAFSEKTFCPFFSWNEATLLPKTAEQVQVHRAFPSDDIDAMISQCQRFTGSIAWFPHLAAWTNSFQLALQAGASVRILLAHPDSEFAKSRGEAALRDSQSARRRIIEDREQLRVLRASTSGGELKVWLTHRVLPLSYLEIDGEVYFSGFWSDRMSIKGMWFSTPKDSDAGRFLADQFDSSLTAAMEDDLSKPFALTEAIREPALFDLLVSNSWVGTMQDVFRDDGSALPDPEPVTLTFNEQQDASVIGLLGIERKSKPAMTIILRNAFSRDRHVCFACENRDSAVRHVGVILIDIDDSAEDLRGFYLGWSPSSKTHHCRKVTFKRADI